MDILIPPSADSLERGFQLAYFILGERSAALSVLKTALAKLQVQCRREKKRFYWRDKHLGNSIRRISRSDPDTLQWLILLESEPWEQQQENDQTQSTEQMLIRYVKHLVRISTPRSSFYVAIALGRLLYNYSTLEIQCVYERLTERYLGADQYRRAKSVLLNSIQQRFGNLLQFTNIKHGEVRVDALEDQNKWAELVTRTLTLLTPWSTADNCSRIAHRTNSTSLRPQSAASFDPNEIETDWCHFLIEPICFRTLVAMLALDAPEKRLALPRFVMHDENRDDKGKGQPAANVPQISSTERASITAEMADLDERRRKIRTQSISILVNGIRHGKLDVSQRNKLCIHLQEDAELVELRGTDEAGELPLATHLIKYRDNYPEYSQAWFSITNSNLEIIIARPREAPYTQGATLTVNCWPRFFASRGARFSLHPILVYAATGIAMASIGWVAATAFYAPRIKQLQTTALRTTAGSLNHSGKKKEVESVVLMRDDQFMRGLNGVTVPTITLHDQSAVINLELPLAQPGAPEEYRVLLIRFADNHELLSLTFPHTALHSAGQNLSLPVPASVLEPGSYYTAKVLSISGRAAAIEVGRFSFYVIANKERPK